MSDYETPSFVVGDGATACYWSDRRAGTIVSVSKNGKTVEWQEDKSIRTDENGMSDSQTYRYERDEDGMTRTFTLRKNGRWIAKGESMSGLRLSAGRHTYFDYSF